MVLVSPKQGGYVSTLKVEVVEVEEVLPHENANRLEICRVKGWLCVVSKGSFAVGDRAVYFPIDSVLPPLLLDALFPPESKIRPAKGRIKTVKIRGVISQGLLAGLEEIRASAGQGPRPFGWEVGDDLTKKLGVVKYDPSETFQGNAAQVKKRQENPFFERYTDIENFKNHLNLFREGERVAVFEKIHGTNFRAGWVPLHADTLWKKIKKLFGSRWEFVYGSHNVQLKPGDKNVYWEAVEKYNLRNVLSYGEVVYGEIYGDGVQKGYIYGCGKGERRLVVFDIKKGGKYLDFDEFLDRTILGHGICLPYPPLLYFGDFEGDTIRSLASGDSLLPGSQEQTEGVVIRALNDPGCYLGRKILKLKNPEFELSAIDDDH
jgi:RNA ligase (TIGR02306 family)